ncbi:MAG TPA: glycosyltransferase domain-containing protein [Lachnospiraceae bacterium]|nr:glycosyltransferase domain-containing protein [Lachnospiraceae bacterium]
MGVIIYGSGSTAKKVIGKLKILDKMKIICCLDSNIEKQGSDCLGYLVDHSDNIKNYQFDKILIASVYSEEIKEKLIKLYGVEAEKIIVDGNDFTTKEVLKQEYGKHYKKEEKERTLLKENKIVIYTAIFGNYDELKEPEFIDKEADYICFTDNKNLKSSTWSIITIDAMYEDDPLRKAKIYKILPHKYLPEYNWSIWVDASVRIKKSLVQLLFNQVGKENCLFIIHGIRICAYEEAKVCMEGKLDSVSTIERQMNEYKKNGFPKDFGLIACGLLWRNHNDKEVIELMEQWWSEIERGSRRDQLSLPYCLWKSKFKFDYMDINLYNNSYFEVEKHNISRRLYL